MNECLTGQMNEWATAVRSQWWTVLLLGFFFWAGHGFAFGFGFLPTRFGQSECSAKRSWLPSLSLTNAMWQLFPNPPHIIHLHFAAIPRCCSSSSTTFDPPPPPPTIAAFHSFSHIPVRFFRSPRSLALLSVPWQALGQNLVQLKEPVAAGSRWVCGRACGPQDSVDWSLSQFSLSCNPIDCSFPTQTFCTRMAGLALEKLIKKK